MSQNIMTYLCYKASIDERVKALMIKKSVLNCRYMIFAISKITKGSK